MYNQDTVLCYNKEPYNNFKNLYIRAYLRWSLYYFYNCAVSVVLSRNMYVQIIASVFALGSSGAMFPSYRLFEYKSLTVRRTNYQMSYFWQCS